MGKGRMTLENYEFRSRYDKNGKWIDPALSTFPLDYVDAWSDIPYADRVSSSVRETFAHKNDLIKKGTDPENAASGIETVTRYGRDKYALVGDAEYSGNNFSLNRPYRVAKNLDHDDPNKERSLSTEIQTDYHRGGDFWIVDEKSKTKYHFLVNYKKEKKKDHDTGILYNNITIYFDGLDRKEKKAVKKCLIDQGYFSKVNKHSWQ